MKATLTFQTSEQATLFGIAWSRARSNGHTITGAEITVYNVDDKGKEFIENYISKLNN